MGRDDGNSYGLLGIVQPQVQNGGQPFLEFVSSRATVAQMNAGTFSAVQANDFLSVIDIDGDDGTNLRTSVAQIAVEATANWSSTSVPAFLAFLTVHTGSTALAELMHITDAGNVGIGTTNPAVTLKIKDTVKLTANSGGSITYQDGTTQTTAWTGVLCGGDYAEAVKAVGKKKAYEPGDVLADF